LVLMLMPSFSLRNLRTWGRDIWKNKSGDNENCWLTRSAFRKV
jgi:hypothetical protein